MKQKLYFLICIVAIIVSCNKKNETNIVTIGMSSDIHIEISSLFDKVEFVQLETKENSLVGFNVEKMELYNGRLFLLNQTGAHKNILCFSIDGKFLYEIDRIGQGKGEYSFLNDFIVDYKKEELVLFAQNRVLYFDLDGKYLEERILKKDIPVSSAYCLNDSTYVIYNSFAYNKGEALVYYLDSEELTVRYEYDKIQNYFYCTGTPLVSIYDGDVLFYNNNDTVYNLSNGENKYFVDFGEKHEAAKRNLKSINLEGNRELQLTKFLEYSKKGEYKLVTSWGENDDFVYITLINLETAVSQMGMPAFKYILYNKAARKSYSSADIYWDNIGLKTLKNMRILGQKEGMLLALLDGSFSKEDEKRMSLSNHLNKNQLLLRQEDDNPVLVILRSNCK